ncbi:MAG: hypothetical protein LBC19_04720 [Tannerella sp.]|jgi:hypothetical protein|nr:hypothetical protein [Tannerella sp.]
MLRNFIYIGLTFESELLNVHESKPSAIETANRAADTKAGHGLNSLRRPERPRADSPGRQTVPVII